MASKFFDLIEVTPEAQQFVERSFLIADQIKHLLRVRNKTQRDLADMLGKKEPEISRMLSGTHNFTLRTIIRLEQALGAKLLTTPHEVQTNAAALTLRGTVASDEAIVADWEPIAPASLLLSSSLGTEQNIVPNKKAAEEPAAFLILEEEFECVAC